MSTYQVVEKFVSINGEGRRAGELAAFIRFKGCNLQCSYCDTSWANEPGCESERLTEEEILSWIRETGVKNVTLTGGEPLLRKGMEELIEAILEDPSQRVEIETNGSVDLKPYHILKKRPSFTMDYKAPDSGMEKEMLLSNLELLGSEDTLNSWSVAAEIWKKPWKFWKSTGWSEKRQFISALYLAGSSRWRSWISLWKKSSTM